MPDETVIYSFFISQKNNKDYWTEVNYKKNTYFSKQANLDHILLCSLVGLVEKKQGTHLLTFP